MKYLAFILGGEGPDVWEREVLIDGVDFMDCAKQVQAKAEDLGGYVSTLEISE